MKKKLIVVPATLSEAGVPSDKFEEMAEEAIRTSRLETAAYVHLNKEDVVKIFEMCR